jgi:spermidine synthase
MLAPYVGMSLYSWTAIIAVVLAGLSAGHWIGGLLSDGGGRRCRRRVAAALMLAAFSAAASLVLIRVLSPPILGAGLGPIATIVVLAAALFLMPSLFVGIVAPILTRLAIDEAPSRRGGVLGQMFALGAAGAIAGTLAAGYLFISWIGSIGTVLSITALYGLIGGGFAVSAWRFDARATAAAAGLVAAAAALTGWGMAVRAFDSPCLVESDYYCLRVVDLSQRNQRPSRLMVLDHLGQGINDRDDATFFHTSYVALTDRLVALRHKPRDRLDAFFIGGGAYSLPRAWLARYPAARLVVAEIDPAVTRLAREQLWLEPSPRLVVIHRDARAALRSLPPARRFDVVVGDAFHDLAIPTHLLSAEFAREVARHLEPDGFYALTVVDGSRRPRLLFSVVRTLRAEFRAVEVWADLDQLAGGGRVTFLVVAGARPSPTGRIDGADSRQWMRWPGADLNARLAASGAPMLTDDYAPVDRLLFPVMDQDP